MSIYAYVGMPGSGKTYDVVANQILPALKADRTVVTNVPLNRDEVRKVTTKGEIIEFPTERVAQSPELVFEYARPGCVLVLDEVWRLWPAGQRANQVPEPFRKLLAEHRHMVDSRGNSMQIVLVTQDLQQIGAFARQLVETTVRHVKLTSVGADHSYRIDIYSGPVTGPTPPEGRRVRQVFGRFDPAVFRCYVSHTMAVNKLDGTADVNEAALDRRGIVWKRPSIILGGVFVVVAVGWGLSTLLGFFSPAGDANAATSVASPAVASPARVEPVAVAPRATAPVAESLSRREARRYRISAVVKNEDRPERSVVWIEDGERGVVVPWAKCWQAGDGLTRCAFDGHVVTEFGSSPR